MKQLEIGAADWIKLPLSWFPAENSHWGLLFFPSLGIQSTLDSRHGSARLE